MHSIERLPDGDSWGCNKISGPTEDYGKMDFCIDDYKHFPVAFTTSVTCYGSYFIKKNSICPINLGHNMFYNGLSVVSALACCWCPLVTPYHIRGCFYFCSVLLKPKWQLWRLQNGTSGIGDITVALSIFYMDQGTDWTFSIGEISISHMNWCGWCCSLT